MIGLDAGNSLDRPPTGVAVYARNLSWQLARAHPSRRFHWYFRSNRYLRSFSAPLPPNVSRRLLESPGLGFRSRKLRLFHGLNQRLPAGVAAPRIATFHDLFALTGNYSTPEFRARFAELARETAARADHVIAISCYTAEQVVRRLGYPRSQVTVVHHGVDALKPPPAERCREILASLKVRPPFALHLGTLQVRKNVERVVEALEAARPAVQLVLAGSLGFGAEPILDRIRRSSARDRIVLAGHVGDDVRAALFARSSVLLFPSLDEGFGLPVVEAFSAGVPVVGSDVSAIPEVAGDAALLVDPLDAGAIAAALEAVLSDAALRSDLVRRGRARAKRFSWERCAAETWRVYERFL